MTNIWQSTWRWDGAPGMPGFTNLFFEGTAGDGPEALAAVTKARRLFAGVAALIPSAISISPVTDVRLLDDATGNLVNIFTVTGIATVPGGGGGVFAAPAGAVVDWITTTVHGSRRLQGRSFIVPLFGSAYDSNGTILNAYVTTIATAAEDMRTFTGPAFGVWGRPRAAQPSHVPPITARAGLWGPAVSSRVPDKTCVLTSRRD